METNGDVDVTFCGVTFKSKWGRAASKVRLHAPARPTAMRHAAMMRKNKQEIDAALIEELAQTPTAVWLGEWSGSNPRAAVQSVLAEAARDDSVAVFVVYCICGRDLGQESSGGAASREQYLAFVDGVAEALRADKSHAAAHVAVVLEPDALAHAADMSPADRAVRLQLLRAAREKLEGAGVAVYVDVGHPRWLPAATAAAALREVGARRFALNVSNFVGDDECAEYGGRVAAELGPGSAFVVDIGRCGNGPAEDGAWLNPPGRALGPPPDAQPALVLGSGAAPPADPSHACVAELWIKPPGESDGAGDSGAPRAGDYYPAAALELARNRLVTTRESLVAQMLPAARALMPEGTLA